jgi:hypothetical protein
MPLALKDAWDDFKKHWDDYDIVNYDEFYGEMKHIFRDIGKLTEPKATALVKVFRDQGWRKGMGAMGKIWEMVIDWKPKSLYAGGASPTYLRQARAKAKAYGLDPKKLVFATDGKHKFSYEGVLFGREGYGDSLSYAKLEKEGKVPKGTTEMKKRVFHNSHEKIKGNWRADKISPNNLALHILW